MGIKTKSVLASYFETNDKPTQAQFADLIDTVVVIPVTGGTGVVEIEATASATMRSVGAVGVKVLGAATTAAAQNALGGTTVGMAIFESATTAAALNTLGVSLVSAATTAQMTTPTSNLLIVTPQNCREHPGIIKAWVTFAGTAAVVTALSQYGVSSITDNGVGLYTINWNPSFIGANNYSAIAQVEGQAAANLFTEIDVGGQLAASLKIRVVRRDTGAAIDADKVNIMAAGTLI